MSVRVLKSRRQIDEAFERLRAAGLMDERRLGTFAWWIASIIETRRRPMAPDRIKSWDIELTLRLLREELGFGDRIVDLGAYNSAVLPALAKCGFTDLHGVDLDPLVTHGPYRRQIRWHQADFHDMKFLEDGSCAAVTAISTIEHGWRGRALLDEVSRVLRPGGMFIASTDFWPEKIDTSGLDAFGMSWTIFSTAEVEEVIAQLQSVGLALIGDVDLSAGDRVINWNGRAYTFVHVATRRI